MIQTVVKRDGRIVGFNEQKIMAAIRKAMLHTDKGEDSSLIEQITDHIAYRGKSQMSVEAIQDAIELELMKSARKDVAQKYIASFPRRYAMPFHITTSTSTIKTIIQPRV